MGTSGANAILTVMGRAEMGEATTAINRFGQDAGKAMQGVTKDTKKTGETFDAFNDPIMGINAQTDILDNGMKRVGGSMKAAGTAALASAAGAATAGAAMAKMTKDAAEDEIAVNKMNTALQNTGNFANMSASEFSIYSDELARNADIMSMRTGVDGTTIQNGQAILATFSALTTETAQSSDMMNRATKAAIDMSAAGFGSVESASKALGKALQDPERGMASLARMGVTFTDQQKEQVAQMVATGDQAGAMGVIMEEVEGKFGGMAETSASGMDKLRASIAYVSETLGAIFLPIFKELGPVIGQILTAIMPLIEALSNALGPILGDIAHILAKLLQPAIKLVEAAFKLIAPVIEMVGKVLEIVSSVISSLVDVIGSFFLPVWEKVESGIETVVGWLKKGVEWFKKITDKIREAAQAAGDFVAKMNPFNNFTLPWNRSVIEGEGELTLFSSPAAVVPAAGPAQITNISVMVQSIDPWESARLIKRSLEGYDAAMGRRPGTALPRAW